MSDQYDDERGRDALWRLYRGCLFLVLLLLLSPVITMMLDSLTRG